MRLTESLQAVKRAEQLPLVELLLINRANADVTAIVLPTPRA